MLIDFHCHVFPDSLAPRAVAKLSDAGKIVPYSDGTVADLTGKMKLWSVDRSVILNIATNPTQQDNVNRFAASIKSDMLIPFCSVHPDSQNPKQQVIKLRQQGFAGMKIHPDYIKTPLDDERLSPIFEGAAECGMITVVHAGYDFISPDYIHCTPDRILKVINKYPGLRLVCAHLGGNYLWDEVLKKLCGKNVWFDTSLCAFSIKPELLGRIINNHDSDKVLFGSDMPWCPPPMISAALDAAGISPELRENINHKNAEKLLGLN